MTLALRRGWCGLLVLAVATCSLGPAAAAPSQPLRFDLVFSDRGEPAALHYRAEFRGRDGRHLMEVWRDGDRLKRSTDGVVETYARRQPKQAEFQLTVLDLNKHIATRIDRANLNRIGNFIDWFDLAHGLKYPQGHYRLALSPKPAGLTTSPLGACHWYVLDAGGRTTQVCWSISARLPLLMAASDGTLLWQVTQLDRRMPPHVFEIHDAGFIHNDANQDIDSD